MNFWESFTKYVGVPGLVTIILVGGYVYMAIAQVPVPEAYNALMTTVAGFTFGKNGTNYLAKLRAMQSVTEASPRREE